MPEIYLYFTPDLIIVDVYYDIDTSNKGENYIFSTQWWINNT